MVLFSLWWIFQLKERDMGAFERAWVGGGLLFSKAVVLNQRSMGKQKHPEVGFTNHPKVVVIVVVVMGIRKIDA